MFLASHIDPVVFDLPRLGYMDREGGVEKGESLFVESSRLTQSSGESLVIEPLDEIMPVAGIMEDHACPPPLAAPVAAPAVTAVAAVVPAHAHPSRLETRTWKQQLENLQEQSRGRSLWIIFFCSWDHSSFCSWDHFSLISVPHSGKKVGGLGFRVSVWGKGYRWDCLCGTWFAVQ